MSLITEERREELSKKSIKELAVLVKEHRKNLSETTINWHAQNLKSALRKDKFVVLSNPSMTLAEMAKALNRTYGTINILRASLLSIGAIERRVKTFTSNEKVYTTVLKLGPSTYGEIATTLGVKAHTLLDHVQRLESEDRVKTFKISFGKQGGKKFGFNDLFDCRVLKPNTFLVVANNSEHMKRLGERIMLAINDENGVTRGMRTSITMHLRSSKFPEEVIDTIRDRVSLPRVDSQRPC